MNDSSFYWRVRASRVFSMFSTGKYCPARTDWTTRTGNNRLIRLIRAALTRKAMFKRIDRYSSYGDLCC